MTGSGTTGLGLALIEAALLDGVPALILDPKGDLSNLCLTFPDLRPEDFAPWVNPDDARREGLSVDVYAAAQAERWRAGLAQWGQDGARIRRGTIGRATTAARGAGRVLKERQDVARARETVAAVQQALADLEAELQAELAAVVDRSPERLEALALRPKRADVRVRLCALGWAPHGRDGAGSLTAAWA
jgi:hypothetical protein